MMSSANSSAIVAAAEFEAHWPFVVDALAEHWSQEDDTILVRVARGNEKPIRQLLSAPAQVERLICLGVPVEAACLDEFTRVREAAFLHAYGGCILSEAQQQRLRARGVQIYAQVSEGFWGESVAEFALGLTICALRQIPQNYHAMLIKQKASTEPGLHDYIQGENNKHEVLRSPWTRYAPEHNQGPGTLGAQYSDDSRFTNGTVGGKRVRIVGAGNIGSRYASFANLMGADVAMWDPFAPEPAFHRAGARRVWHLDQLVEDAEIFAPMLPLTEQTRGVVTEEHIRKLPAGCLVVLATRAGIVHMPSLRERVLADELALAADVFDVEPLPPDDPLLGRLNVVHTPHLAGRTRDANVQWARDLLRQFMPRKTK